MSRESSTVLIEARPGAGKTTALARIATLLRESGIGLSGFLTEEVRERGRRVGFRIEALPSGSRGMLAHVDFSGPPRVGRYGVDLEQLERVALPALRARADAVLVDELGKMEIASEALRTAVLKLLDRDVPVVAAVQASRHPFTDALKKRDDVEVVRLTLENRDVLPVSVVERLLER
jgi:nucleoside-triphosphatase